MKFPTYSPRVLALFLMVFHGFSFGTDEREWTSADGRKMVAAVVAFDGTTATFQAKGGKFQLPAAKLSDADRKFLADWLAAQPKAVTGLVESHAIKVRMFPKTSDYFKGTQAKKAHDYFQKFHDRITKLQPQIDRKPPDQAAAYSIAEHTFLLWVPENYQRGGGFGVYLHLSPSDHADLPNGWKEVLTKQRLLFVSPHRAGNEHGEWFRATQALDCLATVRAEFPVDSARTVIGGFSGGGYMALWTQVLFPELFAGAISHGKDFPLKEQPAGENRIYPAAMPYLNEGDWRLMATRPNRWVFIVGEKDPNAPLLTKQLGDWRAMGLKPTVIAPANFGHHNAAPADLDAALTTVLAGKEPPK